MRKIIYGTLPGLASLLFCLMLPGGVRADDPALPKFLDRSKLSETFRNTGSQGGTANYLGGCAGLAGYASNSLQYPHLFSGSQALVAGPWDFGVLKRENAKGEGVWVLAKDAAGKIYVTSTGPRSIGPDVQEAGADLKPGGTLKLSSGADHPFVQAKIGYDLKNASVWYNSDRAAPERPAPLSGEPVEIDNYRANGQYTLPQLNHFPEEIIITRWKSNGVQDGTGMTMTRSTYGWSNPDFDDFFIVELVAENTSGRDYEEVYMGYVNYFSVNKPGHALQRWNGYYFTEPNRGVEDDRYQYTEANNYTGKYRGTKVSYQYDEDNPLSGENDRGQPFRAAVASPGPYTEGELVAPAYIGWGPVDVTPPFVNDPETYVPITGTASGGKDIPDDQPRYSHWWKIRPNGRIAEFEPDRSIDNPQGIWNKLVTPGVPIQNNPVDGGPTPEETLAQEQMHSQMYGPWRLKQGEKAKIVVVFAGGMASETAGAGGEPMDERLWAMSPGAQAALSNGEAVLFNHIERGRLLYWMGYDLPDQPPDVPSIQRAETAKSLVVRNSPAGTAVLTWTDGADDSAHPDYTGSEAKDVTGYRIYSSNTFRSSGTPAYGGSLGGPWQLIADIKVKDPKYYSNGVYTFTDDKSVSGFSYWYNIVSYAKGHAAWSNANAQKNAIPGAQPAVTTQLADLPAIVQRHVKAGYESSHLVSESRHSNVGWEWFSPQVAGGSNYDALEAKVLVVPNPWKDDGVHSYGPAGANNKNMRFTNLPRLARISIYNAAGDLFFEYVHDGTLSAQHVAEFTWPQRTRGGGSQMPPGIYLFAVESLVPGHVGKTQTGSFVIIK